MPIYRNQPRSIPFQSLLTSGLPNSSIQPTVTLYYPSDNSLSPSIATPVHLGNGCWSVSLTASQLNSDVIVLVGTGDGILPTQREIYAETDWSAARAAKIDNLDTSVSSRSSYSGGVVAGVSSPVTVGGYSAGMDPASAILKNPGQPLNTDSAGNVSVYLNGDKNGYGIKSSDSGLIQTGQAQGGSSSTLVINGGDGHDHMYEGSRLEIIGGTGFGQCRVISGYVAGSQTVTVDRPWVVIPDTSTVYAIKAGDFPKLNNNLSLCIGGYDPGQDPLTLMATAGYTAARASKLDRLDTDVSSRSTYNGSDSAGVSTLLNRLTLVRANNLDYLDAFVTTRLAASSYAVPPSTTAIASAVLMNPEHRLATDVNGTVCVNLYQPVPITNIPQTIGDSLNAARAQGFGAWRLDMNMRSLKLYASDGVSVVREFTLDSATNPTLRS